MEIKFVNGDSKVDGKNTILDKGLRGFVTGYFEVITPRYNWWRVGSSNIKHVVPAKMRAVVVRQKSILSMISTLIHELKHAFVYKFLSKERVNLWNSWIDRNNGGGGYDD